MPIQKRARFTTLPDAPNSFSGAAAKLVAVKADETGLEFTSAGGGTGNVTGPASSTDNAVVRFDGAGGTLVQNSGVIVDDTNNITGVASVTINNTGLKIKDTDASHVLTIAPGTNLTANRTLTVSTGDANRALAMTADVSFTGAVTTAGAFTTSGANSLTLTTTGPTNVTLPTTGTVATLANSLSDFGSPSGNLNINSKKLTSVADPTSAQDAATKAYADSVAAGLSLRSSCKYATTANLVATYAAGILTETGFGALSVDGNTPSVNDRILIKNQTTATDNGIYTVTVVGNGGASYVLTRATDADTSAEVVSGIYTFISAGTANAATGWVLTTADPITLDVTALSFTQFSSSPIYVAGAGLTLTGSTFDVGAGSGILVAADSISVDTTVVQPKDATLTALAAYNTNGFVAQTAADTFAGRTLTASAVAASEGVVIVNGNGVSGNPTVGLDLTTLTNDPTPDPTADYVLTYDASAGTNKKAKLATFVTSGVWFHQIGTTPNEIWYGCAMTSSTTTTVALGVAATTSTMYAVPFMPIIGGTLDRMAFNVNVAVASTICRVGIYTNTTSTGQLYPQTLVVDAGESDTSTVGTKSQTISASLNPGQLYWFVFHADNTTATATGPTVRAIASAELSSILGTSSAFGPTPNTMLALTGQTYAALPGTFPAGATVQAGTSAPSAIVRFSA